ncbi:MAG: GTP-binding protein [Candidatus Hodarchaeota archaeon]
MMYTFSEDTIIKLTILGDGQVGKTSLCTNLSEGIFPESYDMTIGCDIHTTERDFSGQTARLVLWDLAGQPHFDCVRPSFYNGAHVAIIVFSVDSRGSFYDVGNWVRELNKHCPSTPFVLVGNKCDLKREVSEAEAKELAAKYNVPYIETSASKGENIESAFDMATKLALSGTAVAF